MSKVFTKEDLIRFSPEHDTFVGIDSDGCVFDTMEIKQKKCFHPKIIEHWHLESIEKYVRESAEFVNLYSKTRGRNRFLNLVDSFDLLRDRPEVVESEVKLPEFKSLRKWISSGVPLGNPSLEKEACESGDAELKDVLTWSLGVNELVTEVAKNILPFKWVVESLEKIHATADSIVVSQTPEEALVSEWEEGGIKKYIKFIAGQELGTKTEHLRMATDGKYEGSRVLMIGDAPGDRIAAESISAMFYPINPGHEEESWERFYKEAYDKFLKGDYAGAYARKLEDEFEALLPEAPHW
ncbi:HAD family hydrolase [Verrucomicrobiota bacterium]